MFPVCRSRRSKRLGRGGLCLATDIRAVRPVQPQVNDFEECSFSFYGVARSVPYRDKGEMAALMPGTLYVHVDQGV